MSDEPALEFTIADDPRAFRVSAFTDDRGDWWTGEGHTIIFHRKGRGWVYRRSWWSGRRAPTKWLKTTDAGMRTILAGQR